MFIENDLINNSYKGLNEHHNLFYCDIIDGEIKFTDKHTFKQREKAYFNCNQIEAIGEEVKKLRKFVK